MKIPINAYINDEAGELFMNLIAQEYYGEAWELKMKLMIAFESSLDKIMGNCFMEIRR